MEKIFIATTFIYTFVMFVIYMSLLPSKEDTSHSNYYVDDRVLFTEYTLNLSEKVEKVVKLYDFQYTNFSINPPIFLEQYESDIFSASPCYNLRKKKTVLAMESLHGEIVAILNASIAKPFVYCGMDTSTEDFTFTFNSSTDVRIDKGMYMVVPNGLTFQHFYDGVLPKLMQAYEFIKSRKLKLVFQHVARHKIVNDSLLQLGFHPQFDAIYLDRYKENVTVNTLYLTCATPPLHPHLWERARSMLSYPLSATHTLTTRRVVLITRNLQNTISREREMLNKEQVISYLHRRYSAEFGVFDSVRFSGLIASSRYFAEARVILGVHGGGLYNMFFVKKRACVAEIVPYEVELKRYIVPEQSCYIFNAMASLLGHYYWHVQMPAENHLGDVIIDINRLSAVLDQIDKKCLHVQ